MWQTSPMGPFDNWPSGGGGFEHFYGFLGGETNQYAPALYDGTVPVEPDRTPEEGYHLNEDLSDRAIGWVRQQKALMPDKPFFVYFAPGATHAPHHVPEEWSAKYKGAFDQGWDALREETFERQKQQGVIGADADLTERHEQIPAWEAMPDALKPVLARQMEVYAGFLEHTDHHVGRLIDALADMEVLDDTLVYVIIGDNGASAEGSLKGSFNELLMLNGADALETVEFMSERIDLFGTPQAYNHYAVGWAHAMNTPYQWTKQVASHWGGTRNGTIVHWPNGIKAKGEIRHQFHHVIDVAPTVLEAAGLPEPSFVNGIQQRPYEGVSMLYSFDGEDEPDRRTLQYFEMFVNRGIYHEGWTAVTRHSIPWDAHAPIPAIDDDVWELYAPDDWTQAHDLAAENPQKLHELERLFMLEASKYNVFPLDDRRIERFNADIAGRPQIITGKSQLLFGGMARLTENSILVTKNKSHSVTAQIEVPEAGASGVIVAQGGAFGGWTLYALEGKPAVLLQPLRHSALQDLRRAGDPRRRASGTHGVRLRRRRPREGRHRHALRRRRESRRGPRGRNGADGVLRRRDLRRRLRQRHPRDRRSRRWRDEVQRARPLGADRHRRGRGGSRPPHHARGAPADRHGTAVMSPTRRPFGAEAVTIGVQARPGGRPCCQSLGVEWCWTANRGPDTR